MNDKTKKGIFLGLIFLTVYLPFLESSGWDLVNKQAWDLPSFYYAAELVFDQGIVPYSQANWAIAESLYDGTLFAFLHIPVALPFFRVLYLFEYETAKLLILALNHLLTLLLIWFIFARLLKTSYLDSLSIFGLVYTFNFSPLMVTIRLGQLNLIVLILLLLVWQGLKNRWHPSAIGIPLAFATILKLTPALFFAYLLLKKKYKAFLWGLGFLFLALLFSNLILPAGIWQDWVANILSPGFGEGIRGLNPAATSNQGINGFFARSFLGLEGRIAPLIDNPQLGKILSYAFSLMVILPVLWLTLRNNGKKQSPQTWDMEFSLYLVVMFLLTPLAWEHHLVFLLPAIFVALARLVEDWQKLERKWIWALLLGASIIAIGYPFPFNLPVFREGIRPLLIANKLFAVLLIWLFLVLANWRAQKRRAGG